MIHTQTLILLVTNSAGICNKLNRLAFVLIHWLLPDSLLRPANVEHLKVILYNADLFLLVSLIEVLQDDGNVHIDHDHVTDDDETGEVCDCQQWGATVTIWLVVVCWVTVWWLYHQRLQNVIPSSWCHKPAVCEHSVQTYWESHDEEYCVLCRQHSTVRILKCTRLWWAGHVA